MKLLALSLVVCCTLPAMGQNTQTKLPPLVHSHIGDSIRSTDGMLTIKLIDKKQNYFYGEAATRDTDINSPKSVNIHPDGTKYYVNSLEGGTTVCYDFQTGKKKAVIHHTFKEGRDDSLWTKPSGFYPWRHYTKNLNTFFGKPVESTFSHNGRYLWVPYYRRSFDINAQDPSAIAVIDTKTDQIVRLMETGPLPKMIATSPDGNTVAVSHWGNNTVGLIDISSDDPKDWKHKMVLVVDYVLELNYPLDVSVDRDNGSGYALRGTVFTPDNRYLLVGCMGGGGGIAVIDIEQQKYLGRILGMEANVRHLVISNGYLYLSINRAGIVQRIKLSAFMDAVKNIKNKTATLHGWENCKVGGGARTISITPNGRYVFAACNSSSALYIIDTQTMKVIAHTRVDSYPVGLDISSDGRYLFVTSQGRGNQGGNAVNIFEVQYKEAPVQKHCANCGALRTGNDTKCPQCGIPFSGIYAQVQENNFDKSGNNRQAKEELSDSNSTIYLACCGGGVALVVGLIAYQLHKKS